MSGAIEPPETAAPAPVTPLRLLVPSALGRLGIELVDTAVIRVLIDPPPDERAGFQPFDELPGSDFLDELVGRFSEYFAGARRRLEISYDLTAAGSTGFARRVLKETAKIPYGKTRTYQQIAAAAGAPEAYRQVLSILLANPLPVVVPCHRVVTGKSGVGSYIAGSERKTWLLELEQRGVDA